MMKRSKRFAALILTGVMAVTTLFGCGSSSGGAASDSSAADSSSKKVLKVGMNVHMLHSTGHRIQIPHRTAARQSR